MHVARLSGLGVLVLAALCATSACSSSEGSGGAASSGDGGSSSGQPGDDGGGGGADAGGDAPLGDGAAGCNGPNQVCDDFDKSTTIDEARWSTSKNGGSVAIVPSGLSLPNALAVSIDANSGGSVYVEKDFPFTTKVHCELDMKLDKMPSAGDLDLLSITTKMSNDYFVYFAHSAAGFQFAEFCSALPGGGSVDKKQPVAAPPMGSWFHVVFDNDGKSASLTINGATTSLSGLAQPAGSNRYVQIGTPFSQGTNDASRVLYDNVACTFGN